MFSLSYCEEIYLIQFYEGEFYLMYLSICETNKNINVNLHLLELRTNDHGANKVMYFHLIIKPVSEMEVRSSQRNCSNFSQQYKILSAQLGLMIDRRIIIITITSIQLLPGDADGSYRPSIHGN